MMRCICLVRYSALILLGLITVQIHAETSNPIRLLDSDLALEITDNSARWRFAADIVAQSNSEPNTANHAIDNSRINRRFWRDFGLAGKTIISDLGHIYSAPARLNQRSAAWLGGIVGVGAIIYVYDREIRDAIHRSHDAKLYKPVRELGESFERTGHMGATNRYYLGAIMAGYLVGYKPLVMIPAEILEAQLVAGTLKDAANILVGRSRPFENRGARHFDLNNGTSFPSGHAKNIAIAARVISRRINFLPIQLAAYTVAGSVLLQRVSSDSHWPSDVYFGAIFGWISANELLIKHDGGRLALTPTPPDANHTLGLHLSYTF